MDLIYSYTRAQAIADGVLVDVSAKYPTDTRCYKTPVAVTAEIWSMISGTSDPGAWVWDLCFMSIHCRIKQIDESTFLFAITMPDGKEHVFKAMCHPGDDMEPVVTFMLPNQD